jgi:hypothetical protein
MRVALSSSLLSLSSVLSLSHTFLHCFVRITLLAVSLASKRRIIFFALIALIPLIALAHFSTLFCTHYTLSAELLHTNDFARLQWIDVIDVTKTFVDEREENAKGKHPRLLHPQPLRNGIVSRVGSLI